MTEAEKFCKENNVKFRLSNIGENIGVVALEYINMLEKESKISEEIIIGEQQEINELKKQLDCCISLESHYEEIEEDAKAIAKENEELKKQLEDLTKAYTLTVDKSVVREQEFEKENEALKQSVLEAEEIIAELKAQIEDMKVVGNCEHSLNCVKWVQQHINSNETTCCKGCSEWEIKK